MAWVAVLTWTLNFLVPGFVEFLHTQGPVLSLSRCFFLRRGSSVGEMMVTGLSSKTMSVFLGRLQIWNRA